MSEKYSEVFGEKAGDFPGDVRENVGRPSTESPKIFREGSDSAWSLSSDLTAKVLRVAIKYSENAKRLHGDSLIKS